MKSTTGIKQQIIGTRYWLGNVHIGSLLISEVKLKSKYQTHPVKEWNKDQINRILLPYIHVPIELIFPFCIRNPSIIQSQPSHALAHCSYRHLQLPQHQPSSRASSCSIRFYPNTQISALFPLASHDTSDYDTTHFFTAQSTAR